jgi:FtsZ-binding cell division protein ZapB
MAMTTMEKTKTHKSQFRNLINRLIELPLWVREAIYCELKSNISEYSDIQLLDMIETKIIQLYKPLLTGTARKLIENQAELNKLDKLKYTVLINVQQEMTLLEIAHDTGMSLKATCLIILDMIDTHFIEKFTDSSTENFVLYITGKIRLGEFLVRTNRITSDALDKALYTMKCAEEMDAGLSFKDILVNLNYMSRKEANKVTAMKLSAEMPVAVIDEAAIQYETIAMLQDEIDNLRFEKQKIQLELEKYKKLVDEKNFENLELSKQLQKYTRGFVGKILTSMT